MPVAWRAGGAVLLLLACGLGAGPGRAQPAQGPSPQGGRGGGQPQAGQSGQPQAAPANEGWVQRGTAELVALDKVRAQPTPLQVKVGQSAQFHSLTIAVRSCAVRPPDQAPDATAFVDITDSAPGAPGMRGWLIASAPWLNMLQHPIYDVRVVGCRP